MQNLIDALQAGNPEFRDGGEIITRPPTAVMIRAAKALAQLASINEQNAQIIMQQQQTINNQLQEIQNFKDAALSSVRDNPEQIVPLADRNPDNTTSNQDSTTQPSNP